VELCNWFIDTKVWTVSWFIELFA